MPLFQTQPFWSQETSATLTQTVAALSKWQALATTQALDALDIDENWLPELIDAREVVNAENQKKQNLSGELAEFSSLYQDKQKQHKRTRRGWSFFNALTWILIPLMLIAWGLWIAFNFFPTFVQKLSTHDNLSPTINKLEGLVSESGGAVSIKLITSLPRQKSFQRHLESLTLILNDL